MWLSLAQPLEYLNKGCLEKFRSISLAAANFMDQRVTQVKTSFSSSFFDHIQYAFFTIQKAFSSDFHGGMRLEGIHPSLSPGNPESSLSTPYPRLSSIIIRSPKAQKKRGRLFSPENRNMEFFVSSNKSNGIRYSLRLEESDKFTLSANFTLKPQGNCLLEYW